MSQSVAYSNIQWKRKNVSDQRLKLRRMDIQILDILYQVNLLKFTLIYIISLQNTK